MAVTLLDQAKASPTRVTFAGPTNSTLYHNPTGNTAAVGVLSLSDLGSEETWVLRSVLYSYNATPTTPYITIGDGTVTAKYFLASNLGPGELQLPTPRRFGAGKTATITLVAGGTGVTGTIDVADSWIEKVS